MRIVNKNEFENFLEYTANIMLKHGIKEAIFKREIIENTFEVDFKGINYEK